MKARDRDRTDERIGGNMPDTRPEETVLSFFDAFNRGDLDAVIALYEPGQPWCCSRVR